MLWKKQWSTTFNEDTLKEFQANRDEYGMKANIVMEALMKFFSEGNCRRKIRKNTITIYFYDSKVEKCLAFFMPTNRKRACVNFHVIRSFKKENKRVVIHSHESPMLFDIEIIGGKNNG